MSTPSHIASILWCETDLKKCVIQIMKWKHVMGEKMKSLSNFHVLSVLNFPIDETIWNNDFFMSLCTHQRLLNFPQEFMHALTWLLFGDFCCYQCLRLGTQYCTWSWVTGTPEIEEAGTFRCRTRGAIRRDEYDAQCSLAFLDSPQPSHWCDKMAWVVHFVRILRVTFGRMLSDARD